MQRGVEVGPGTDRMRQRAVPAHAPQRFVREHPLCCDRNSLAWDVVRVGDAVVEHHAWSPGFGSIQLFYTQQVVAPFMLDVGAVAPVEHDCVTLSGAPAVST